MSTHRSSIPFDTPADGAAVLIRGPPMSGKFDLLLRTLATGERGLVLSTGKSVDTIRDTYATYGDPATLGVVDCVTGHAHEATGGERLVRHVSSPQNLTELGVKFTDLVEILETGDEVVVGLHSLSELLMYWDPQRIYQFTRVLLGQVHDLGWGAVAVLDDAACDEQVVHTLTEPFDVLVDTRRNDGRELRVQRTGGTRTAWIEF